MASDQSTQKNRVHKGVHNQKPHYKETSHNEALKPTLYKQIQHRITRNANSYFSAFTNAATQTERHFSSPQHSILFCVPAPDFAMFFCPAH
ncbi:hypothetical protein ACT6KS_002258 [Escherichia coli]|uniref:hypothetical protein n=1 Tax=Escherichia coli TaxID=562 RepID=UPI000BE6137C|nr:hypothetical protein [Escherichia coli]EER6161606.1 hypothetical protein [Escherichia coli]EEX9411167.1 hypothetical protein [Escherichia coli]EFE3942523.1 hypothetical protein [Escherichia coli]EFG5283152.1 hypothetical protein [Escherichia coli]EFI6857830.1 hypothetical protein [Escherichia coli]